MRRKRSTMAVAGLAIAIATGAIGATAATGATKFGANLTTSTQPSNAGNNTCHDAASALTTAACTRVAKDYGDVGAIGGNIQAPKDGTIKKIKLIAAQPGSMTPFVVKLKNFNAQTNTAKGKATAKGPKINYASSINGVLYTVQSFKVDIAVKKGEYLAIKAKTTSMLRCNSGSTRQLLFQPPLKIGNPFATSNGRDTCVLLIQAVMK